MGLDDKEASKTTKINITELRSELEKAHKAEKRKQKHEQCKSSLLKDLAAIGPIRISNIKRLLLWFAQLQEDNDCLSASQLTDANLDEIFTIRERTFEQFGVTPEEQSALRSIGHVLVRNVNVFKSEITIEAFMADFSKEIERPEHKDITARFIRGN